MSRKKVSTVDFDLLLGPSTNLAKLVKGNTVEDKTAATARVLNHNILSKVKKSGIGTGTKRKVKATFNHLTGNKRIDPSESPVTRAGKEFGLSEFWTKAR